MNVAFDCIDEGVGVMLTDGHDLKLCHVTWQDFKHDEMVDAGLGEGLNMHCVSSEALYTAKVSEHSQAHCASEHPSHPVPRGFFRVHWPRTSLSFISRSCSFCRDLPLCPPC